MRLESRLAGMAIGAEGADHDEVRLRLEIMMSQIELLQEGDLGKFINKSEQRKTVVATLIRNLHLLDKQVDTMTPEHQQTESYTHGDQQNGDHRVDIIEMLDFIMGDINDIDILRQGGGGH